MRESQWINKQIFDVTWWQVTWVEHNCVPGTLVSTWCVTFYFHDNPMRWVLLLPSLFYRWESWWAGAKKTPGRLDIDHILCLPILLPFKYRWPGNGRGWGEVQKQVPPSPQARHPESLSLPALLHSNSSWALIVLRSWSSFANPESLQLLWEAGAIVHLWCLLRPSDGVRHIVWV